ncbi:hypothetical protein J7L06_10560 [Candidatus Bathyarchaeota archaeon]|nr:hypothetical protein [Candidatus Bathyarchaeota archaeon]
MVEEHIHRCSPFDHLPTRYYGKLVATSKSTGNSAETLAKLAYGLFEAGAQVVLEITSTSRSIAQEKWIEPRR